MRFPARIRNTLCVLVVVTLIAVLPGGRRIALAGGQDSNLDAFGTTAHHLAIAGMNHRSNWISPAVRSEAKKDGLLFVSDGANNVVDIFPKYHPTTPIGQIVDLVVSPRALAVDRSGNLFVVNGNNSILEFKPPYTSGPFKTYVKGLHGAFGILVGSDGTLYASNFASRELVEYPRGKETPTIIELPVMPLGLALDSNNNLFASYWGVGASGVLELTPGSTTPQNLLIPLQLGVFDATLDANGNLLVVSQAVINVYPPGSKKPSRIINPGFTPFRMAFSAKQRRLYITDGQNIVRVFSYPSAKVVWNITGVSQALGVALSPPAPQ